MYTPLYIKTDYSLLSSLIKIDDLIIKVKEYNITSLGICDDSLCSLMEFYTKCKKNNIKPIVGLDLKIDNYNILLYIENYEGYKNLIKIETMKNKSPISLKDIEKYLANLLIVLPYEFINYYEELNKYTNNLYIGISNKHQIVKNSPNVIFINKTLYLEKHQYKYLPYIFMIRDSKTIADGLEFIYQDNYLSKEIDIDKSIIDKTNAFGDKCNLEIDFNQLHMPKYNSNIDSRQFLISLAHKGLMKRLNNEVNEEYLSRLNYELDIITKMHFEDYFLVVYDFIKYAKSNDILVGPGRGSAAGSLVSYCLGITSVDPIKYNLLFERFLNPQRITMPDIDTDFPDEKRDLVIKYVRDKYSSSNVAGIVTFGTLQAKQAIRDVGRVLNINIKDIDYLCKKIGNKDSLKDFKKNNLEISNFIDSDNKLKLLYNIVTLIEKNKRHTSSHAAGIVISNDNLNEILPIIHDNELSQTEFTMEYLECLGLIKMDFLGIKNLTTIDNIIKDINKDGNNISFSNIELDDSKVINSIFAKGDTLGIFQFESDGMKSFLKKLKPSTMEDLFAAIALFRPGPAQNISSYIKRKQGLEKIDYIVKDLEEILKPTYGIIIYQEQIMLIARKLANYTLGEADILRRAMSKKKYDVLKQEEQKFINNAIQNGYNKETIKKIYDLILAFANYGFNRSHSVSYALVAYKMAYLKYYYRKYFYSNLLTGVIGSEIKTKEYINELKKNDLKVLPPDINISDNKYIVTSSSLRAPLSIIRNIGVVISSEIIKERKNSPYKDIFDFFIRTYSKTNNSKVITSLILSSCFQSFGYNKKTLIENIDNIINYVELAKDVSNINLEKPQIVIYDEYDSDYLQEQEKELFGFYLTTHKTEKYKLQDNNIIDLNNVSDYLNKNISIIMMIDSIREIVTKNNKDMTFINGSDNTGDILCLLFAKLDNIAKNDIAKIIGKVEKRYDEYQLIINRITKLN